MLTGYKFYAFGGLAFARAANGEYPTWFERETIHQADEVLDSDSPAIDVGGRKYNDLQIRALFDDRNDARALELKIGQKATLAKTTTTDPRSMPALLIKAVPVYVDVGIYGVDCTFKAAP